MLLQAYNIHKSFKQLNILKGIDFEIGKSEMVAITGKSGAGKSTFLHIISTLDVADLGEVNILGKKVSSLSKHEITRLRNEEIGFVFQFHHLVNEFTAVENVMLPLMIKGDNKKLAREKATEIMDFVGLSDRLDHSPVKLSGGEQQRVAIARAIVHKPAVIFADEPTGNLDTENSHAIFELFDQIRNQFNTSFVIVTHDTSFASRCDRIAEMKDGCFV